jgi:HSP20 family protein
MSKALTRSTGMLPSVFDDFMKPWNEWFDNGGLSGKMLTVPAVNIIESKDQFELSVAVPGMKKEDFGIDVEGNLLTISAEKEENREERLEKLTRQEYNYSSFRRTFTLPDEIKKEDIEAKYLDGVLKVVLPKREEAKKLAATKHIAVK